MWHVFFVTEIKRLSFLTIVQRFTIVYAPPICILIQQSFNGLFIEYCAMSIPDNRPCFSTNTFLSYIKEKGNLCYNNLQGLNKSFFLFTMIYKILKESVDYNVCNHSFF